jgi:hypothetical protein
MKYTPWSQEISSYIPNLPLISQAVKLELARKYIYGCWNVNTHLANTVKNRNLQNCVAKWQIRSKYMRQVHYSLHTINDWLMIKSKFTIKEYYWLNKNIYITYQFTGIQSKRVWLNVNELIECVNELIWKYKL